MSSTDDRAAAARESARTAGGQFGEQERTDAEVTLPASTPELDDYWSDIADSHGLDDDERAALASHIAEPGERESWTAATTTQHVIHAALEPGAQAAAQRTVAYDKELNQKLSTEMMHIVDGNGAPAVMFRDDQFRAHVYEDGNPTFTVAEAEYTSAGDIPGKYRKARRHAQSIEEHTDAIREAARLREDADQREERLDRFRYTAY